MDLIFVSLPRYLIPVSILLKKIGYPVFYLGITGYSEEKDIDLVKSLDSSGIRPLQIESLLHISGFTDGHADPQMKVFTHAQQYAPEEFLRSFQILYQNNPDISKKLLTVVHNELVQSALITTRVNIWARANQDRTHLLIDVNVSGLFLPALEPNVRLLAIPVDIVAKGVNHILHGLRRISGAFRAGSGPQAGAESQEKPPGHDIQQCRIAFVPHQGLLYGNLYEKDLFYSDSKDSVLHLENMLHLDYSGFPSPSVNLKWEHIGNHRRSMLLNVYHALVAIRQGISSIHSMKHILGLLIIARSYVVFRSYLKYLERYPSLEFALIDYEILCPKELLLAFESRGIVTIAAQERFTQSNGRMMGSILTYYLCSSPFAANLLKKSPAYCVDHYIPVGQYRSDILVKARTCPPPSVLAEPIAKGYRIITALGFHTVLNSHESQMDPVLNWTAHQLFIDDMLRLAKELSDVFIILRYKDIDWLKLPRFGASLAKIRSSENMTISVDYVEPFVSSKLCAHSDLVIAKPTSLADECLSIGIPVLFHGYFHNFSEVVSDAFDYSPTRVLCSSYEELQERSRIILSGMPNEMSGDYQYLKDVVYGGLGDGRVKERIHAFIEKLVN
jgi:hypothetical protein